jgi:hypothetical protein
MTWTRHVDNAIDMLLRTDPSMVQFTRRDIAKRLKISPAAASQALNIHRSAQKRGVTKHLAVSRGAGRAAIWVLLDGSGATARALTMGHAQHVANDLARRAKSDIAHELEPAMASHPIIQAVMAGMSMNIEQSVLTAARTIQAMTAVWESQANQTADLRGVVAV